MEQQDKEQFEAMLEHYAKTFSELVHQTLSAENKGALNFADLMFDTKRYEQLLASAVQVDTSKLMQNQMQFMQKQTALWEQASKAMMGERAHSVVEEERGDKRFSHEDWQKNPVFNYLKQSYLLNSELMKNTVEALTFADSKAAEQARFYTRQYVNSVSPTNSAFTNPEVCDAILQSNGQNLLKGMQNFIEDLEKSPVEAFKITQTDASAFEIGKDLAATPGQVVFKNEFIELIHYTPVTEKQFATPVLITPPFINKYYILDMDERKSMVRWLLSEGYAVFIISWVNPDVSLRDKDFVDYMKGGPLTALDVVTDITKAKKVNMVGWCVGGTLLSLASAHLRAKGDERINSVTLLTTLLDFSKPGELGNYMSAQTFPLLEQSASIKGIFDGRILGLSFSLLRENNLFWSFFIKNYLKGEDPAAFDILYWNSDATNLTAACFKQYLEFTYIENQLQEPGKIVIDDIAIDLANMDMPCYFLTTLADHIVLWDGAYTGTKLVSGPARFVLAGSGHLAGVINPVKDGKYPHWLNDELPENAEEWFEGAQKVEGSWWPDWHQWMSKQSGRKRAAWQVGEHPDYPALYAAPGEYVKKRL